MLKLKNFIYVYFIRKIMIKNVCKVRNNYIDKNEWVFKR